MTAITSAQNPAIKAIRALSEKKHRTDSGLFLAEGEKVLARARDLGWEPETVLAMGPVAPSGKARVITVSEEVMAAVSGQRNPPPVAATFRQRWQPKVTESGLWLALDELRDPGNLGTIIRTADAVGAAGIILAGNCADPYGPDCVRATMGSIFALPLVRLGIGELAGLCRSWPGETVAAVVDGAADYRKSYGAPTLLAIGSEGRGLVPDVAQACATRVRIPMQGGPQSLNVAIATALLLFEIRRPAI
ncbi:MAG: RNA methyltransferase [Alphaproteobacteria bacterium]|nr:RNA methyltransferase [Alphaproteobacteria bacterium]